MARSRVRWAVATDRMVITIEIGERWWLPAYLRTLVLVAWLTGAEPDIPKVVRFVVCHGLYVRVRRLDEQ